MRAIIPVLLALLILPAAAGAAVQGDVSVKDGQRLVRVWGTHEERGYAMGYLLGDEAIALFRAYVNDFIGWCQYGSLHDLYGSYFLVPADISAETTGLLNGTRAAGTNLRIPELNRELDKADLAIMSSIPDLGALGYETGLFCSSVSAWSSALEAEPGFDGDLVHARNLEWADTAGHDLAAATIVLLSVPSEADEQPWVAVTFPGMLGALSAMNASGVGLTLNMGNYKLPATFPCNPILMTTRRAIEAADVDGDGASTVDDVGAAVLGATQASSYILSSFMRPAEAGAAEPAVVVETNAVTTAFRHSSDDPLVSPDVLLATNHHRTAYPPVYCDRYETLQNAVVAGRPFTSQEVYDTVRLVSQGVWTLQSMILRPDPLDVAVTHIDAAGAQSPLVHFSWAELTNPPVAHPSVSGPCYTSPGETTTLDAGAGYAAYLWSTGETTRTIEVAPTATTTYGVTVTKADGWQGDGEYTVKVWDADFVLLDCFETGTLGAWSEVVGG